MVVEATKRGSFPLRALANRRDVIKWVYRCLEDHHFGVRIFSRRGQCLLQRTQKITRLLPLLRGVCRFLVVDVIRYDEIGAVIVEVDTPYLTCDAEGDHIDFVSHT